MSPENNVVNGERQRSLRVWISGASGFIGRWVVRQGLSLGHTITVAGRQPLDVEGENDLSFSEIDLRQPKTLIRSLENASPEVVLHLGGAGVADCNKDFNDLLQVNTVATVEIAKALSNINPTAKLVMAGSGFEYGNHRESISETDTPSPGNAYGISKLAATHALRLYQNDLSVLVLRIFGVYGPGEAGHRLIPYSIAKARRGEPIDLTTGLQERDFLYVEDAARAIWQATNWISDQQRMFEVCNLGSGRPISLRLLLTQLHKVLAKHGIEADYRFGARDQRVDEVMHYVANISKIKHLIGWDPTTDVRHGLQKTVESYLATPLKP